jgi:hypothetical protein
VLKFGRGEQAFRDKPAAREGRTGSNLCGRSQARGSDVLPSLPERGEKSALAGAGVRVRPQESCDCAWLEHIFEEIHRVGAEEAEALDLLQPVPIRLELFCLYPPFRRPEESDHFPEHADMRGRPNHPHLAQERANNVSKYLPLQSDIAYQLAKQFFGIDEANYALPYRGDHINVLFLELKPHRFSVSSRRDDQDRLLPSKTIGRVCRDPSNQARGIPAIQMHYVLVGLGILQQVGPGGHFGGSRKTVDQVRSVPTDLQRLARTLDYIL